MITSVQPRPRHRVCEGDWLVNLKKVRRPLEQFATEVK
jgi:nitroreductase / dihydropteridine reductase